MAELNTKLYAKSLFLRQGEQLIKLFNGDMNLMMNGLIKINDDYDIDFSFIDKILYYIVGVHKDDLLEALHVTS